MKSKLLSFLILAGLITSSASATIIQLATTPVNTQPSGNGDAAVKTWVDATIVSYNQSFDPDVPAAGPQSNKVAQGAQNPYGLVFDSNTKTITLNLTTLVGGYIVLGWGSGSGGTGTLEHLYYIKDAVGGLDALTFTGAPATGGLSAIHVYGGSAVPDGGATVVLLGAALTVLAIARRRFLR